MHKILPARALANQKKFLFFKALVAYGEAEARPENRHFAGRPMTVLKAPQ